MIKSLEVHNLQSHPDTKIEFDSGVNIIIGPSDGGKSALFRALNLVLTNRPLGDDIRSEWGGDTIVEVVLTDGNKIKRVKSDKVNAYYLNDVEMKAFGQNPPEEVLKVLQMDMANIQFQEEPAFLLSDTSGEVALKLNSAASFEAINKAISGLKNGVKQINSDIEYKQADLNKQQQFLSSALYKEIPEIEGTLTHIEKRYDTVIYQYNQKRILEKLIQEISVSQTTIKKYDLDSVLKKLKIAEQNNTNIKKKEQQWHVLSHLCHQITNFNQKTTAFPDLRVLLDRVAELNRAMTGFSLLEEKIKQLQTLIIELSDNNAEEIEKNIKLMETEYAELMPNICPLCGRGD